MTDIEFPLSEGLRGKNIQKIVFDRDSNKLYIFHNRKAVVVDVDLSDITKTKQYFEKAFQGKTDSSTKDQILFIIADGLGPYMNEISNGNPSDTSDKNGNKQRKQKDKTKTKIQVAFDTVKQQARNLFVDEYKTPYVAIPIQDHLEIFPINSHSFKDWYRMFIFERDRTVLDNQTINDVCSLASAYAASSKHGSQINLNLRTASYLKFGKLEWNYDLTNKDWEFIKITSNGWDIFKDEIIFRRYNNQQQQVYPDRNYAPDIFDRFMNLVNIKADDKDSILLLKCYIISLFIPDIQKVVLILYGSQGAAKSTLQELIKMLVDPSIVKTLTFPRDLNELIQQLSHNHIIFYDNVSSLSGWVSDQLCRAVSGSGSTKRQLYTDDDDIIRSFKRCVGINGINVAATKADLLDRSLLIPLERIRDGKQRTPEEIWNEFNLIKAQLLAYVLDILVKVLQYEQNTQINFKLSRMSEFAKYGEIIARCIGYKENEFLIAYERNRQVQTDEIIDSSQLATVIICMMFEKYESQKEWIGTPTELHLEIKNMVDNDIWNLNIDTKDRYWPKKANSLVRRLNELLPALIQKGLEITRYKESNKNNTKKIRIRKIPSEPSQQSEDQNMSSFLPKSSDAIMDDSDNIQSISSENIVQIRAQIEEFGRETISDGIITNSIIDPKSEVENPTKCSSALTIQVDKPSKESQTKRLKKCPECDFQDEPFYLKVHLENKHGITQELEIRKTIPSGYHPKPPIMWTGDVSRLIKINGTEVGDQTVYDAYPSSGNITLKNNFITGHLRMRGRDAGQYPYKYLEFINRVFDATSPVRTIEVCSRRIPGLNKCGNCFTVDIQPKYKPDLVTDGQTLEGIKDNYFERWRCDPPYNAKTAREMYGTQLPSLSKLLEAGARVVNPGSLMFLLCSQNFQPCPSNVKRIGFIYISVVPNNETRILNIYVKLPEPEEKEIVENKK